MFKRVDRRLKRREIEETLGLDDDERGVFGLHDTDSSESESDADESASSSATSSGGHRTQHKRKRGTSQASNDDESNEIENSEPSTDDEEDENGRGGHGTALRVTIASALKEPIRLILTEPETWVCTFCPGKTLKHVAMVKVHEGSRIHRGRFKRIQELAMDFSPDEDIRNVLAKSVTEAQPKADGPTLSRRAEARKAKQTKLKEKRKKIKERKAIALAAAKAKKAAKTAETGPMTGHLSDSEEATQASKRLKVESNGPPRKIKRVHRTSLQAEPGRILTKASRKNKGTTKTLVPTKSKGKPQIHGATSA